MPKTGGRGSRKGQGGFQGQGKGQGRAIRLRRPGALNLSCFQEKQSAFNGKAVFVKGEPLPPPPPPPPPLASEGSESPPVVRGAGGGRSLPSTAPQTGGFGRSSGIKGAALAHVLTRSVLALRPAPRAASGASSTPLPLENRGQREAIYRPGCSRPGGNLGNNKIDG